MNEIIKKALERVGMTQKELAERMYVTPQAVSKWVSGASMPSVDNIAMIKEILGVDLIEESVKASRKGRTAMKRQHCELQDLSTIEKARDEAKLILEEAGIAGNYPHHIYILVEWLVTATIGLTYHKMLNDKDSYEEFDYSCICCELESFFEEEATHKGYRSELAYRFFLMGGDLFESFGEYRLENHDYGNEAMSLWYDLQRAFGEKWDSPLLPEFKVALLEVISYLA